MGVIYNFKQRREQRKYQAAMTEFFNEVNVMLRREHERQLLRLEQSRDSLAAKVERGDAVVLGVNDEGKTIVAERSPEVIANEMAAQVRHQDEAWARENERIDRAHRALRAQFTADEAPVSFGHQVAGGKRPARQNGAVSVRNANMAQTVPDGVEAQETRDTDVSPHCACGAKATWRWNTYQQRGVPFNNIERRGDGTVYYCEVHGPNTPYVEDDGGAPTQAEVNAILNAGMSDSSGLVGTTVLYQTDGRGDKDYVLPAIVTCVRATHPDVPLMNAAREARLVDTAAHRKQAEVRHGYTTRTPNGWYVGDNPVPVPIDGTVHLKVLTPGPQGVYDEFSVSYDAQGSRRSWRHLPSDRLPF